jgi:hypothetical protein
MTAVGIASTRSSSPTRARMRCARPPGLEAARVLDKRGFVAGEAWEAWIS